MRIALAQINPTVGDFSGNFQIISRFYEQAAGDGAELVIFPELATAGYPPADLLEKETFVRSAEESLHRLAELTSGENRPAMLVGSPMRRQQEGGRRVRNVAAVLEAGEIRFTQTKRLLPFYDVFDEQRYFEPASRQSLTKVKGHAVAITVCEDAWNDKMFWPQRFYPNDPVEELMTQWAMLPQPLSGHRLILNISASPYWHGKPAVRRRMIRALAERHGATVVMVNQVGANDSLIFDGDSFAMNPRGEVIAQCNEFEEDLVVVDTRNPQPVTVSHRNEAIAENAKMPGGEAECERTWKALVLGTRDYLRKCGFRQALLGLSGGIDSALVAAIAVEAIGAENIRGVGMPSEFSSEGSVTDAERLAKNLGIEFDVVPVRAIYEQFSHAMEPFFKGTPFGLAEENLQPRIRGSLLMALSNKQGGLVLTTGNKSEMATGYCTLYGDMVGALAVIGDLYKTEVYALSRYANREREIIPQETIEKEPSAELRPGQKDTDSLPPYEVLDPILRAYVEDYRSADEIAKMRDVSPDLVRRIIRLVELAEYKRQQAAPVLKVSKKAFGMGRRFPIAARRDV
ncbi:MAG TPA: NAD+ synthase [Bryocella sp.]|nr:NAD+ synthase [Bryocella sp.]